MQCKCQWQRNCQFLQLKFCLCLCVRAFFFFIEPTAPMPFLTAPCCLCLASHLPSLVDYIDLHPSHLPQLMPSFLLLMLVGSFPLFSPTPNLHSLSCQARRWTPGTISLPLWAQFNSELFASLTPSIMHPPVFFGSLLWLVLLHVEAGALILRLTPLLSCPQLWLHEELPGGCREVSCRSHEQFFMSEWGRFLCLSL